MRFAFKTATQSTTWAEILAVWKEADQIDLFESGWIFDHFYPIDGNVGGPCLEGWTTLTALALATERLRLGTLVTGIHYRHPAVLANMVATLDIISNGRLELGSAPAGTRRSRAPTASSSAPRGSGPTASRRRARS